MILVSIVFLCLLFLALTAFSYIKNILYDLCVFVIAPKLGRLIDLKAVGGEWAVITGAGAGIGRGYTLALARKGINVCLVGRTESKLKDVARVCEEKYKVKTRVIVHDFSKINPNDSEVIKTAIGDIFDKVGILVNNVGIMGGEANFITPFIHNIPNPISYGREMVTVNVQSVVLMTGLFLPFFIRQDKGILINVASSAAFQPLTGGAVYSATKSFVEFFTESLRQECQKSNVIIQTVNPFTVKTDLVPKLARLNLPSFLAPAADNFAESAVNSIGLQERTCGSLSHNLQGYGLRLIDQISPKGFGQWIRYVGMLRFKSVEEKEHQS